MKNPVIVLFIIAGISIPVVSSVWASSFGSIVVDYIKLKEEFGINQVSQTLTILLLISSFLERALEVYVLTFRNINDAVQTSEYKDETRKIALWAALTAGILISVIGIRGIEPFIILDSKNNWQNSWFRILDIFLTGAVIAGGSDVIHKILQVFTTFMEAIATSNKAVKVQAETTLSNRENNQ